MPSGVLNMFVGFANYLGLDDAVNSGNSAVAEGKPLTFAVGTTGIVASVVDIEAAPVSAIVVGETGAALSLANMIVTLNSPNPLTAADTSEATADAISAGGYVAMAMGGVGAAVVLSDLGLSVAAVGTLASVALGNYQAIAHVLQTTGVAPNAILPSSLTGYQNPTVYADSSSQIAVYGNSPMMANLGSGYALNNVGPGSITEGMFDGQGNELSTGVLLGSTPVGGSSGHSGSDSATSGDANAGGPATYGQGVDADNGPSNPAAGGSFTGGSATGTVSATGGENGTIGFGFSAADASATQASLSDPMLAGAPGIASAQASLAGTTTAAQQFEGDRWAVGTTITVSINGLNTAQQSQVMQGLKEIASDANLKLVQVDSGGNIQVGVGDFDTPLTGAVGNTTTTNDGSFITGANITIENPDALAAAGVTLTQVAAHEGGHALGLADSNSITDPHSVMNAELGTNNTTPDSTDAANLASLYGNNSALDITSMDGQPFLAPKVIDSVTSTLNVSSGTSPLEILNYETAKGANIDLLNGVGGFTNISQLGNALSQSGSDVVLTLGSSNYIQFDHTTVQKVASTIAVHNHGVG